MLGVLCSIPSRFIAKLSKTSKIAIKTSSIEKNRGNVSTDKRFYSDATIMAVFHVPRDEQTTFVYKYCLYVATLLESLAD